MNPIKDDLRMPFWMILVVIFCSYIMGAVIYRMVACSVSLYTHEWYCSNYDAGMECKQYSIKENVQ
jgi:hypothetical protein